MDWEDAKSTSIQSGHTPPVPSLQTPPAAQFRPFLSPSIAALAGKLLLYVDEAVAVAPLEARATFKPLVCRTLGCQKALVRPGSPDSNVTDIVASRSI